MRARVKRTFYDAPFSANTYKVRLLMHLLDIPHDTIKVSVTDAEPDPKVHAAHPAGRVPLIVEDGRVYAESNAILIHLARGTDLWPDDPSDQDEILPWLFFEQNSIEPQIGNARVLSRAQPPSEDDRAHLKVRQDGARWALRVLDDHLADAGWVALDRFTIADVALYAYTHRAQEAGIDLSRYPHIQAWLGRVQDMPDFIGMEESE